MSAQDDKIIRTHTVWATGAGLLPLPLVDLAAVTAIQVDLLHALADANGIGFSASNGKALVSALTGTTLARLGATALKAIPGIGSVVGGLSMSIMSGASTYAIGRVAASQIARHGTLFDMDVAWGKARYAEAFEEGKKVASDLKQQEAGARSAFDKLEQLAKLHQGGVLTDAEFAAKKAELLAQIA